MGEEPEQEIANLPVAGGHISQQGTVIKSRAYELRSASLPINMRIQLHYKPPSPARVIFLECR